jgi:hypothetical protein
MTVLEVCGYEIPTYFLPLMQSFVIRIEQFVRGANSEFHVRYLRIGKLLRIAFSCAEIILKQ